MELKFAGSFGKFVMIFLFDRLYVFISAFHINMNPGTCVLAFHQKCARTVEYACNYSHFIALCHSQKVINARFQKSRLLCHFRLNDDIDFLNAI